MISTAHIDLNDGVRGPIIEGVVLYENNKLPRLVEHNGALYCRLGEGAVSWYMRTAPAKLLTKEQITAIEALNKAQEASDSAMMKELGR